MNLPLRPADPFSAPGQSGLPAARARRLRISLVVRMGILITMMALLTLAAGAGGFWLNQTAATQINNLRVSGEMTTRINTVQMRWLNLVEALDAAMMNRPSAEDRETLQARLNALNEALDGVAASVEQASTRINSDANRQILLNLRAAYARTDSLSAEIFDLAADEQYTQALEVRKAGMPALQARVTDALAQLEANIAGEALASNSRLERNRMIAQGLTASAILLALIIALNVVWIGRRVILLPLASLTDQITRLSHGDFSPPSQMERGDEISDLSIAVERMAETVRDANAEMERRIQERTAALERRTVQVQAAAQTARDITSARSLTQLLENAVELIRERFGFYHAGIFLTDGRGEYETLRAATGEAGRAMLARAHSLRIGEAGGDEPTGLVGASASRGEALVSSDVDQDQEHFKNPLLPETRSEAALPLKAGGRVIGVLDVQSRQPDAFDAESLNILQVMADQLAIAIQNASLLAEVQRNLADMQQAYGELERKAWLRFFQASPDLGYVYDGVEIRPLSAAGKRHASTAFNGPQTEGLQAEAQGPAVEKKAPAAAGDEMAVEAPFTLPLRVRGQEIGALEVWPRQGRLTDEETYLLTALNSRLSQILESARLYEETQARAAREELINRLTAQIARAMDLDGVLRAAAVEFAGIPAVREVTVALVQPEPDPAAAIQAGGEETDGGGNGHRA